MIVQTVLLFGLITAIFELVLLILIAPRWRLRILGSPSACAAMHVLFLTFNLIIHWGTLIGTMSGILAFIASMLTIRLARTLWGTVQHGVYERGLKRFHEMELR